MMHAGVVGCLNGSKKSGAPNNYCAMQHPSWGGMWCEVAGGKEMANEELLSKQQQSTGVP